MSGAPSTIGYGWQLFGYFPFGSSDWSEEVTWAITPAFYREDDLLDLGDVAIPLRKWTDACKPLLEELRIKWEKFPSLWDANTCPLSNLPQLAYTVGLVDDPDRPEALRRSRILNVAQLVLNKGNDQGYMIVGAYEGLLVAITPLWAADCFTTPAANFQLAGPSTYFARFDEFAADEVSCDLSFSDLYARWPRTLTWEHPCRTAWLDLYFYAPGDTEIQNFQPVAERIVADLERFTPIHVRLRNLTFDGPRMAAGGWTIPVQADVFWSAGGWTIPVSGTLSWSAGGWTIPVTATPTP